MTSHVPVKLTEVKNVNDIDVYAVVFFVVICSYFAFQIALAGVLNSATKVGLNLDQ